MGYIGMVVGVYGKGMVIALYGICWYGNRYVWAWELTD